MLTSPPVSLRRVAIVLWLTGLLLSAATSTMALGLADDEAQVPSRAGLLKKEREAKAAVLVPPERAVNERRLNRIQSASAFLENITGSFHGFTYTSGHFPAGAGFGYGLRYAQEAVGSRYAERDLPNQVDLNIVGAYSTRRYYRAGFDLAFRNVGASFLNIGIRGQSIEFPEEDYFGLGPDSVEKNRSTYLLRSLEGGIDIWLEPARGFRLGGGASSLSPRIGSGRDSRFPSVDEIFDDSTIPGFQGQPDFWRYDGFVDFDYRDQPRHPRSGGFYGVRFSNYIDRDFDTFEFRQWEIDTQQYIHLPNQYRVLALRANVVISDTDAGQQIPFYYMPHLGGSAKLRGFREFRFRDENSLLLTAEYRWEAWWALDIALFVEAGKVALRKADLDLSDLEWGYGIGFRVHSSTNLVFRLDLAFSKERSIPLMRSDHVF